MHPRPWAETESSPILRWGYLEAIVDASLNCFAGNVVARLSIVRAGEEIVLLPVR